MHNKGRRTTEEEKKQFIELFNSGYSIRKIAKMTDWSECTVTRWLKNNNLDTSIHKFNQKKVIQLDKQGNEIARYNSLLEAQKVTDIDSSDICHCLRGFISTAGGYVWKRI